MNKNRLEAFSDGVIAIIITIMVLELKVPHGNSFADLLPLGPVFLSYVLSYVYVGIYWSNHHHMFQAVKKVNGTVLWANLHLLFWLSLLPFTTAWAGENHFTALPTALYGLNLMFAGLAYGLLAGVLRSQHGKNSSFSQALGNDFKGKISPLLNFVGFLVAFWMPMVGMMFNVIVAVIWVVPDKRFERRLERSLE